MVALDLGIRLGWQQRGSQHALIHRQDSTYRAVTWTAAAPADGTWAVGDMAFDSTTADRVGWRCTVAGTPGTWVEIGAGGGGSGDEITINGSAVTDPDFNDSAPAAPGDAANVIWQESGNDVSAYIDGANVRALQPPGAPANSVQFNDGAGGFGGLDSVLNQDGTHLRLLDGLPTTTPSVADGSIPISIQFADGFPPEFGAFIGDVGAQYMFPSPITSQIGMWLPQRSTTITQVGMTVEVGTGSLSTPTPVAGSTLVASRQRWRISTTSSAGTVGFARSGDNTNNNRHYWIGDAAGRGGFTLAMLGVCLSAANSDSRTFFGLNAATTMTSTNDPSTTTNTIGFSCNAADTTWHFISNDASGGATRVDLGSDFPKVDTAALYDFFIHVAPNGSTVYWHARRLDASGSASGSEATDIPANTVFMQVLLHIQNSPTGGTAVIASWDCSGVLMRVPRLV